MESCDKTNHLAWREQKRNRGWFDSFFSGRTAKLALLATGAGVVLGLGCSEQESNRQRKLNNQIQSSSEAVNKHRRNAFLTRAINLIKGETLTNLDRFENSVSQSLNSSWNEGSNDDDKSAVAMQKQVPDWKRNPLADTFPKSVKDSVWAKSVAEKDYLPTDAYYVQESYWLDRLQDRILSDEENNRFIFLTHQKGKKPQKLWQALKSRDKGLNNAQAELLASAVLLFDWTVRNVSGDEFYGPVEDVSQQELESLVIGSEGKPNSKRGIRGPGYGRNVWQILQYGRGDAWQRGHLFLQLARHAKIPAFVIGLPNKEPTPVLPKVTHTNVVPWAIGVPIGDKVYLLDPRLGLPLFHKDTMAVLSLQEAAKNPDLLFWHGLNSKESVETMAGYPVSAEELKDLVALVDFPSESISLRMAYLEKSLTGSQRIPLSFDPTELVGSIEKNPLFKEIVLWGLAEEIHSFRSVLDDALDRSSRDRIVQSKLLWLNREESYIDDFPLIREARLLFLLGKFQSDNSGLTKDCRSSLLELLYTEKEINSIVTDRELQKKLGLYSENQTGQEFKAVTKGMQDRMRLIRNDVMMYLAAALIDMEEYSSALNWLGQIENRLAGAGEAGVEKWRWSCYALKARCLESIGRFDDAVKAYEKTAKDFPKRPLPQRYGNVLRARILKAFVEKQKS